MRFHGWKQFNQFSEHITEAFRDVAEVACQFCDDWSDRLKLMEECALAEFAGSQGKIYIDLSQIKEFNELVKSCEKLRQLPSHADQEDKDWIEAHKDVLAKSIDLEPFVPYLINIDILLKQRLTADSAANLLLMERQEMKQYIEYMFANDQAFRDANFSRKVGLAEGLIEHFVSGESKWGNPRLYTRSPKPSAQPS